MVRGRLQQQEKSGVSPLTRDPYRGLPDVFSTPPSGRKENPPSLTPTAARVGGTDTGVFTSWCHGAGGGEEGRGGVWNGEDRNASASAPEVVARIGPLVEVWRPVGWAPLDPGCSLAQASARWTAPAPLPPYKRERAVSRGIAPPH